MKNIVIGSGPAGRLGSLELGKLGEEVTLIEKNHIAGTCLNEGCMVICALTDITKFIENNNKFNSYGFIKSQLDISYEKIVEKITETQKMLRKINEEDNVMEEKMMNENAKEMNDNMFDLANAMPHCPVVLVLDTSHSMWGQGLTDMMASLKAFYKTIADIQFLNAEVDIAAVSMGDNLCMLEEFTPLHSSDLPNRSIRPKGDTPIGAALELAQEALQAQISRYQAAGIAFVTPNLILLSDGKSTDDFQAAAEHINSAVESGKLICRAIALGQDADMDALASIAGRDRVMIPNFGGMRQTFAQVGQIVSQTYEEEAQEVITEQAMPVDRHIGAEYLLDGSNILHWDEYRTGISLKHLLAITDHLKKAGQPFQVFFDATAPHILKKKAPQEKRL